MCAKAGWLGRAWHTLFLCFHRHMRLDLWFKGKRAFAFPHTPTPRDRVALRAVHLDKAACRLKVY